ncbi:HesB/IscA family protein [Bradyrhizobium sp. DOA9]|uniref:HesB/IscA family protein n=1 Tax=Bradyrhizobium sp. DOA9 TaxID=1126627 RepID=UPI000469232D|nr:iron-sulfur cluster assembly accessory protein [Bradyrhizobium sp. DOA9]GAJ37811.1 hypothetical protein blr1755 [Bradyrhizobium sp. DOA9]
MINLTDSTVKAVKAAISAAPQPASGLRVSVEAGGCAGFKYMMGLAAEHNPGDTVVERSGVKIFVDSESQEHLNGTTIDLVLTPDGSGFTFDNPNAKSRCSCGSSFG